MTPARTSREPLRSIAVVGGGLAGWMTAAALSRALVNRAHLVRLVDIPEDPSDWASLGAPESSIPPIRMFHAILGVDEDDLIRKTAATFKLGVEFKDWAEPGSAYVHPYGEFGAGMESVAFHHYWLRMRGIEGTANLDEYSLAATAAKLARFTRPVADPGSVLSTHAYGLHVDSGRYAQYMRDYAEARGVGRVAGEIADVRLRGEDGFIEALELKDGERIEADLFVDCTGSRGVLIGQALEVGYEDWTNWLFCDRAVLASCDGLDPFPLTRAIAHDAGWRLQIPLQNGAGAALVFSSAHLSDDEAVAELLDGLDGEVVGAPRFVRFRSGRRKRLWHKNCVAIGAAAGFLDPLESTNLHLIQNGVSKLAGLLPDRDCMPGIAAEYDRLVGTGFERLRDLVVLHYKLGPLAKCEGAGSDNFWRRCREMNVPDSLSHKVDLFQARGRVALTDEETFLEPSWISAFVGQQTPPRRYDPLADMVDLEIVRESMRRMRTTIREAANTMPSHRAYLSRIFSTTTAGGASEGARSASGARSNS